MTRNRFAASMPQSPEGRTSARAAMLFDVSVPETEADSQIAEQRVAQLRPLPVLLAFSHLLAGLFLYLTVPFASVPALMTVAFITTVALDLGACLMLKAAPRLELRAHNVQRLTTAYLAIVTCLWCGIGTGVGAIDPVHGDLLTEFIIGTGAISLALVAIATPAIAIMVGLSGVATTSVLGSAPYLVAGIGAMSLIVAAYSTANARAMLAVARKRLRLDEDAHKALRFVNEFENSGQGWFWETNASGLLTYVSRQLADDFRCEPTDLLGRRFTDLLNVEQAPGETLREERTLGFHLSARFPFSDVVVRPASDEDVHWSMSGNPIFCENGRFLGFRGMGTDLTEQRRSEQEISRLARFDSLTSLPNRAMMRQMLDEALRNASRRKRGCTLFLIDLDRFKNVNDTLGHPVGDALLRQVAERLTAVMGDHGQVGRLGGDEFKAVLPGIVETGLLESLARTMIDQVSRPYVVEGHRVTIGASIGIAIGDPDRACADSMIRNADLALYAAKAAGRGKHFFFEPSMHSEATERQMLENDLRGAIERGELWVSYQPLVRATSEDVCGFEALVRWDHPTRGAISPERFIAIAEECGLIPSIGKWVLDQAVAEAIHWPDSVRIAINLSPIQFNDPKIVETVAQVIEKHGLRAERLELEITEGVFLADSDATEETFARLKSLGVRLALDDFGTGYSSLGYLKKAPFDKIKIDQSFVRGATSETGRHSAIIRAIVTLADSLGMDTTAEGVETHDVLNLVRDFGVSQIQGFIFGKPVRGEEARELAKAASVVPEGFSTTREPRHRLMRRAIVSLHGAPTEIRLRNISAMGALVECPVPLAPGTALTIDIVGVGPVVGTVRWAQSSRFGIQFEEAFDLSRLTAVKPKEHSPSVMRPWYVDQAVG
ncbi:putative bifunctional diguanylate cyclase/phosphodiesterase [Sphingomicrobium nitratireducens]|uniref:putative bifunctional diguanylate cyclase/phosphodiesterase n=1 Tax=Sphingomicrobium nitratireducens TaxID=2964666 RepID=UPI0022405EF2|nr:EAL domain-containing protein [Sphingomicrobium nitratireducens]